MSEDYEQCPECDGEGMIYTEKDGWKICPTCKGWGEILKDYSP